MILISVRTRNNVNSYFGAQKIIYYSSGGGRGLNSFKIRSFKTYIFTCFYYFSYIIDLLLHLNILGTVGLFSCKGLVRDGRSIAARERAVDIVKATFDRHK